MKWKHEELWARMKEVNHRTVLMGKPSEDSHVLDGNYIKVYRF